MQADDLIVRVRRLDGQWEQLASGQDYGIVPESVNLSSNLKGPDKASFLLQRDPARPRIDLMHDTPIEFEVGGSVEWDGRIMEAPAGEAISVQCDGWQYAQDDGTYTRPYVQNDLSEFKDMRSFLTAGLGEGRAAAAGRVNQEDGALTLMFEKGYVQVAGAHAGVVLDAGPDASFRGCALQYETSNNSTGVLLYVRGSTTPDSNAWTSNDILSGGETVSSLAAKGIRGGNLPTASRYLHVFIYNPSAAGTLSADVWVKIKDLRASYAQVGMLGLVDETAGLVMAPHSRLRADHVVLDAISRVPGITVPTTFESASFRDEMLGTEEIYSVYRFFGESASTVNDESGNQRHAAINGAVTFGGRYIQVDPDDPDPASGLHSMSIAAASSTTAFVQVPVWDPTGKGLSVEAVFRTPSAWAGGSNWATLFSLHDTWATAGKYVALFVDTGTGDLYFGNQHGTNTVARALGATVTNRTYYVLATWHDGRGFALSLLDPVAGTVTEVTSAAAMTWTGGTAPTVQIGNYASRTSVGGLASALAGASIDEMGVYLQSMTNMDATSVFTGSRLMEARRRGKAALLREVGDVKRTGLAIPSFTVVAQSPREAIDAANDLHGYQPQVLVGGRFRYRALPRVPLAKIGDWGGSDFEDTSNNSGRDVVNSVKVVGTSPAGEPVVAKYSTADLPDAILGLGGAPQLRNPSFDVDISDWSPPPGNGVITRDTSTFSSSPASLLLSTDASRAVPVATNQTWAKLFLVGKTYNLTFRVWSPTGANAIAASGSFVLIQASVYDVDGVTLLGQKQFSNVPAASTWVTMLGPSFRALSTSVIIKITIVGNGVVITWAPSAGLMNLDDVRVLESQRTVLDRQGGFREKTLTPNRPITQAIASQLAKLYLLNNMTTPFKGNVTLSDEGMRGYRDDQGMPARRALSLPGELLHVADRHDPDMGSLGRDGRVVSASWSYGGQAQVALDNERGGFQALMARYGVKVTG